MPLRAQSGGQAVFTGQSGRRGHAGMGGRPRPTAPTAESPPRAEDSRPPLVLGPEDAAVGLSSALRAGRQLSPPLSTWCTSAPQTPVVTIKSVSRHGVKCPGGAKSPQLRKTLGQSGHLPPAKLCKLWASPLLAQKSGRTRAGSWKIPSMKANDCGFLASVQC